MAGSIVRGGDVRATNRRVVLELIERHGPISRADLARQGGLSMPSVSEIVSDLLASGLVAWHGEGASTGGRRPLLLRANPARATVLAADLGGTSAALALFLLDGTCLSEERFTIPATARGNEVVRHLVSAARRLLAEAAGKHPEVLGMGVAAPGVTDPETGEVTLAPAVGWTGTPVRYLLEQELGIPVVVDNDVNAAALAEWRFGDGARYKSFVFVSIGTGVGSGIILNGQIHRGLSNQAGEIGYMVMDPDWHGAPNDFGDLESRISLPALARDYARTLHDRGSGSADPDAVLRNLVDGFAAGDPGAVEFLTERVRLLARALVNVFAVLAPEAIFLGGPISPYVPQFLPALQEEIVRLVPFRPVLLRSALQQRAGLIGACALATDMVKVGLLSGAWRYEQETHRGRQTAGMLKGLFWR